MNSTQNKKIRQVTEKTMIVGIDVGSVKHYFRAFDWRGIELTRRPIPFNNSMEGFNAFHDVVNDLIELYHLFFTTSFLRYRFPFTFSLNGKS